MKLLAYLSIHTNYCISNPDPKGKQQNQLYDIPKKLNFKRVKFSSCLTGILLTFTVISEGLSICVTLKKKDGIVFICKLGHFWLSLPCFAFLFSEFIFNQNACSLLTALPFCLKIREMGKMAPHENKLSLFTSCCGIIHSTLGNRTIGS